MRIAYLVNQYPTTSHSFIRREIRAIEALGHQVFRISIRGWGEEIRGTADEAERLLTHYVLRDGPMPLLLAFLRTLVQRPARLAAAVNSAVKLSRRAERPLPLHLIYLLEACVILNWLRAEKIEHLHAHFGTNSAEVAMLVRELGGPPFSFTPHGPEEFDKARFIGLPEKIARASFVAAVSSFGRSQLYRYTPYEMWDKIKVIHCGLEKAFYEGVVARPASSSNRLVCVGRLCEQKGQSLLIEAASLLAKRGADFELVLAGDGEMRGEIENLISQAGLRARVRITGWISSEQVREEILGSRALVLPSFAEGLPVVIMEAMSLRRPVISTFIAGIPELVVPGEHGWLVPAGDGRALAEAMQACLGASSDTISEMGESARTRVLQRHDVDQEAAKLADLFAASITPPSKSQAR